MQVDATETSAVGHPIDDANEDNATANDDESMKGDINEGEQDEDEEELDDDEDEDEDEEAEAIAKRLGDQLWADINRAHADRARSSTASTQPHQSPQSAKKAEAALATMKTVLSIAEADPAVNSTFAMTMIPGTRGESVLSVLKSTVASGILTKEIATPLSHAIVALAKSTDLFPPLPVVPHHLQAKRKRDDEGVEDARPAKKTTTPYLHFHNQLKEAVQSVRGTLDASGPSQDKVDPTVISSIQLQLHQVFLFAATSAPAAKGDIASALQEITGLIQVLGVLSNIQITLTKCSQNGSSSSAHQANGIGTAVYPCLLSECNKIFSRLYSLRQHQRVHSVYRPFKCDFCVASFVRNHDLKRHLNAHDKRAFKCCGCNRVFSRRDAIKRHKDNSKKGVVCAQAAIEEVDSGNSQNQNVRDMRRNKLWDDITSASAGAAGPVDDDGLEEGELDRELVTRAQEMVVALKSVLQSRVTGALGNATVTSYPSINSAIYQTKRPSPPMGSLTPTASTQPKTAPAPSSLPDYGLNDDQAKLLELAIANATAAAQAQAEAEAMLEEEEEYEEEEQDEEEDEDEAETHDEDSVPPTDV